MVLRTRSGAGSGEGVIVFDETSYEVIFGTVGLEMKTLQSIDYVLCVKSRKTSNFHAPSRDLEVRDISASRAQLECTPFVPLLVKYDLRWRRVMRGVEWVGKSESSC